VKVFRVKQDVSGLWRRVMVGLVQQLHDAGADGHGDAHDDALAHAVDRVLLTVVGSIELKTKT
jgi:hypothetical protein